MKSETFLLRVQDRQGALERLFGTLRRKSLGVERISLFPGPKGTHEVLLATSATGLSPERVRAELEGLVDVREVTDLGERGNVETRELALVRVPPGSGASLTSIGRLVGQDVDGDLLEITGSPEEVDAVLADLSARAVLNGYHRTGEVPAPPGLPSIHGETEDDEDKVLTKLMRIGSFSWIVGWLFADPES